MYFRIRLIVAFFGILPAICKAADESEKVADALAILDTYHSGNPQPANRKLHIVSWRSADRDFPSHHRERLQRNLEHIQTFYGDEMERLGFGRRTIGLDLDPNGKLVIHEVTGAGNYADYGRPDGERIRKECWPVLRAAGIDPDRETVMIFTNLSEWDPKKNTFFHKSPYYARGNHRAGLAWQLDSPELDVDLLDRRTPMIQDGEYGRISLGKHVSIFVGGIAHELGHALGLPHCQARADEANEFGTALMGSGNRTYFDQARDEGKGTFLTLANALRLASHPQFSGSIKGMNLPVKTNFEEIRIVNRNTDFDVVGRIASSIPTYAVVAYLDPEGNSNYNARTATTVPDQEGRFSIKTKGALVSGKPATIRVVACLVNGATATWSSAYSVSNTGIVDTSMMKISLELTAFLEALNQGNTALAEKQKDSFPPESLAFRIAEAVMDGRSPDRKTISADKVPADSASYPLSKITPGEARVGWLTPAYDYLPQPEALLASGAEIFTHGIYAHAAALHRYQLKGGGWQKLTGRCGLPNRQGGSVVFAIRADGKEVFRSKKLEPGITRPFDVDLSGVNELELTTEDGGDGKAGDWGVWFNPELHR